MSRRCPLCGTEFPDTVAFCGHDGTITIEVQRPGDAPDARLGARYGDYVVVARVADGAMGRVYEARHAETKQRMAIKVLHEGVAKDRVAVERFRREFETARDIDSPFVVRVVDFGEAPASANVGASWYLTMEYLQGAEVGAVLRSSGALPLARALRVVSQIALGLEDAHSFGVIHRDLKPDNLFLCESPEGDAVRILDFGSVKLQMETGPKLTAFGTTLGSPYYMSPEQAMGKQDVDPRTDGFALAAIAYECFTGKIAFEAPAVGQILLRIVNEMPIPASSLRAGLPPTLDDVLEKGLAKDKKQRYASTVDLASAILASFGLPVQPGRAGVEQWARTPIASIEQALAAATPPAPAPFGAPMQQASPQPAMAHAAPRFDADEERPKPAAGPNRTIWIAIAVGLGVVTLLGAAAMLFS